MYIALKFNDNMEQTYINLHSSSFKKKPLSTFVYTYILNFQWNKVLSRHFYGGIYYSKGTISDAKFQGLEIEGFYFPYISLTRINTNVSNNQNSPQVKPSKRYQI